MFVEQQNNTLKSCDTKDWSNGCWIQLCNSVINYILKHIKRENGCFYSNYIYIVIILHIWCVPWKCFCPSLFAYLSQKIPIFKLNWILHKENASKYKTNFFKWWFHLLRKKAFQTYLAFQVHLNKLECRGKVHLFQLFNSNCETRVLNRLNAHRLK